MIRKGYSKKRDGSMHLSMLQERLENLTHREQYFDSLHLGERKIVAAELVHGTHIERVTDASDNFIRKTDALITTERGIVLTLTGADCFPVFFENSNDGIIGIAHCGWPRRSRATVASGGIIGLAHCGWRGILAGMVPKMLSEIEALGGAVDRTRVTIGPGICAKHFEIREDILPLFLDYPEFIIRDIDSIRVDLRGIIRAQLDRAGVRDVERGDKDECTFCLAEKYFSYRRDKPSYIEAQVAYIMQ